MSWLTRALGFDASPVLDAALEERAGVSSRVLTATDGRDILHNDPDGWEVEQPWLWWTGPSGGNGSGGPFGNPPPGAGGARALVSMPAVTRCTSIICNTIAGLPWNVYRNDWELLTRPDWIGDPQGLRRDGRILTGEHDAELVRLSAVEFWAEYLTSALWFGDGYAWVPVRDRAGNPRPPMFILNPAAVTIRDGRYYVDDVEQEDGEIIHLRGEPPYAGGKGTGVIDRHGADLQLAATVREYAAGSYSSGVPAGYLKVHAPQLTQDQADTIRAKWLANHGNSRRSIAVLNATTDFQPIQLSPIDAQLDKSREWSMRDIALAFGVPPYMLGVPGDSSTYANVESRMIELRTFTLLPWIRRLEATLDAQFPRGTTLKVNTDGTLRADTKTRYESYSLALAGGWLTVDEVRAFEDRPPLAPSSEPTAPPPDEGAPIDTTPAPTEEVPAQ